MDYKLFKMMKDKGFPQKGNGKFIAHAIEMNPSEIPLDTTKLSSSSNTKIDDLVYCPTLEELIEACEDRFDCLIRKYDSMWICYEMGKQKWSGEGSTPREAVANLYLSLNSAKIENNGITKEKNN